MVRLKREEIDIIKDSVAIFDPEAKVFLFGSRVDPNKKGGDIDLLVLSHTLKELDSLKILKKIYDRMEEQKIDILIASDTSEPFVKLALRNGVEL
jgi:uncharacterized protein